MRRRVFVLFFSLIWIPLAARAESRTYFWLDYPEAFSVDDWIVFEYPFPETLLYLSNGEDELHVRVTASKRPLDEHLSAIIGEILPQGATESSFEDWPDPFGGTGRRARFEVDIDGHSRSAAVYVTQRDGLRWSITVQSGHEQVPADALADQFFAGLTVTEANSDKSFIGMLRGAERDADGRLWVQLKPVDAAWDGDDCEGELVFLDAVQIP